MRKAVVVALCCTLFACDARLEPEEGPTRIRFVNVVPDALTELQFTLPQGPSAVLQQGASSAYLEVAPRTYAVRIEDDDAAWSVSGNMAVVQGLYQSLIAFGTTSAPRAILVRDETNPPRAGNALVRILHLAPHLTAPFDAHVVAEGQTVVANRPLYGPLTYPANPGHLGIVAQTARIVLTTPGTADVIAQSDAMEFVTGAVYTVVVFNDDGGTPRMLRLRDGA